MESLNTRTDLTKKGLVGVLALVLALAVPILPAQATDGGQDHSDGRPDLVVTDITLSVVPEPGETVEVSFTVSNAGAGLLRGEWVDVQLRSEDYSLYFWDYVEGLASGGTKTFVVNWTAPERVHVLTATVDRWDNINETNESNNAASIDVIVGDPKPDLAGWGPLLVPTSVMYGDIEDEFPWRSTIRDGDDMTLFAPLGNIGTAPLHEARFQTFLDGTLYDDRVLTQEHGFRDFALLVNWTATVGTHTFRVVMDPLDSVDEKNETNNELALTFTVLTVDEPVPDLAVVSVDFPEDVSVGNEITFTATIENTGTVASEAFDTFVYVSNLGEASMRLPGLDPGEQASISVNGHLPIDGQYNGGNLYWAAVVDPFFQYDEESGDFSLGGDVPEDNETNNYFTGRMPVRLPDLVVTDVRLPGGPFVLGDEAFVEVDVANIGDAGAFASFQVQFSNGETRTIHGLDAGDNVTLRYAVTIDWNHVYAYVRVDPTHAVGERSDHNNTAYLEEYLESEIDASLEADSEEVWTGQVVTLTARFQNSGDLWNDRVYAAFYVDGRRIASDYYQGVDEDGVITATVRWTPLQESLPPTYGARNFTVEMEPIWFDTDWENNSDSTIVTVKPTPLPLPV